MVGVLSLVAVVGRWDGFNDLRVWWIGIATMAVVQSDVTFDGWVFDLVGFYMDFMSTTAINELVGKAERR